MSFQPVVSLTTVPRDNSGFTLLDVTPTDMVSGYGSSNAPATVANIAKVWVVITPYGEDAQQVPIGTTSIQNAGTPIAMPFAQAIVDGVNTYSAIYLWSRNFNYVVSADGLSITIVAGGLIAALANAKYLALSAGAFPVPIVSVTDTVITLSSAVTANTTGTALDFGYVATLQALTTNNGEALCINGISLLPVEADSCDNAMAIFHNLTLKLGAEIAFNCGLISKAHEAARLLGGGFPNTIPNCASCG